jgi:hypothetical protein
MPLKLEKFPLQFHTKDIAFNMFKGHNISFKVVEE